jgi:NADP-dependent 3-hydroxy acid dehydrogenase YdfG
MGSDDRRKCPRRFARHRRGFAWHDAQGFGQIINISSIGGLHVASTAAVYSTSKFAVRAISNWVQQETN